MAETRFIRTVLFGGYDKGDVDKKLDYVYNLFFDNKNKLRETKLMLDKMKGGASEQDAIDSVLAGERAKLTELQVKNENLVEKARSLGDEIARKDQELQEIKAKLAETETKLTEAEAKLASEGGANSGAMLNVVFQQAQTSANLIVTTAQQQAANLENDSKKLAENTITDANNKAKVIIYEAETNASKITTEAEEKAAAMEVASGNVKALLLSDIEKMSIELSTFKAIFDRFGTTGTEMITKSQELLSGAVVDLTAGGIPVFKEPEKFEAEMADFPTLEEIDDNYLTGNDMPEPEDIAVEEKKSDALAKLKEKAASMGGSGSSSAGGNSGGGKKMSLEDIKNKAKNMK
ncbi:MAG: hypothetical protein II820_06285 [Ruminiclostridium sp.]|nr:hypothetical protein [Ruminiclostridium sp.]